MRPSATPDLPAPAGAAGPPVPCDASKAPFGEDRLQTSRDYRDNGTPAAERGQEKTIMQTTTDIFARSTVSATALASLIATSTLTRTETYGGGCGTVERRYYAAGFSVDVFGDTMVLRPGLAWREALASRDEAVVRLYLAATGSDILARAAADAGLLLRELAEHESAVVRWRVACHRECPSDVLAGLAGDINRRVVWAAINNDACPMEAVQRATQLPPERRPNTGFPSIVVDDQLAVRAREILAARSVA